MNLRPEYAAAWREADDALWDQDALAPELLEMCRLRIAQLLGVPDGLRDAGSREPRVRLDPSIVEQIPVWPTASGFSAQQKACLGFAEQVLLDAQGVEDEMAAELIDAIGDGGFLVLSYGCGFFETTLRARLLLAAGR